MQDRFKYRVFDNDDKRMHDVIFLNYKNNSVEWYNDNNSKREAFYYNLYRKLVKPTENN